MKSIMELISMQDRRVLITGASSGIGRAMAGRFASAGAALILLDIDEAGLAGTLEEIRPFSGEVRTHVIDLSQKNEIDLFWKQLAEPYPEVVINNAGVYPLQDYLKVEQESFRKTLQINLESAFWMSQHFISKRKNHGGIIINLSSIEAILPFKHDLIPYSISKAGVIALTRSLARDYGKRGFRANVILPGAIKTPGTKGLIKTALTHLKFDLMKTGYDFQSRLASGRWGTPDEVACVALFLASDLSSYVQGAVIPVDGGFLSS